MVKSAHGIVGRAHTFRGKVECSDLIELEFVDEEGNPIPNVEYILTLPDGSERRGTTDADGYLKEEGLPPGEIRIRLVDGTPINLKKHKGDALGWLSGQT